VCIQFQMSQSDKQSEHDDNDTIEVRRVPYKMGAWHVFCIDKMISLADGAQPFLDLKKTDPEAIKRYQKLADEYNALLKW
jgi:hypothetical protein